MSKVNLVIIVSAFCFNSLKGQEIVSPSPIKWYTVNEAFELNKKQPRPIMIDVYTNWCSWCKFMMKTTFANKGIANFINRHFYAARFNAEILDSIEFKNKKYINRRIGRRPVHDLANHLLDGRLSYPSLVFYDRSGKKYVIPGFKETKDIEPILVFFNENLQTNISIDEFILNFIFAYPEAFEKDHSIFKIEKKFRPDTLGILKWQSIKDFDFKFKKKPKPTLLFMQTKWCVSCNVMDKVTFKNTEITDILNENFYTLKVDASSQDTINFMGKKFYGTGENLPHQLAKSLFKNKLQMPAVALFDEKGNLLTTINGYLTSAKIEPILKYFLEKKHLTMKYQDFLKEFNSNASN